MTPQQQAVLDYLETHDHLTNADGYTQLGQAAVWKRISELIRLGYPITKETHWYMRDGRPKHYTKYRLEHE